MIRGLLDNWKTTSAGLTLIIGAIVHIAFLVTHAEPVTEKDVMLAIGAIFAGVGMLAAGDASKSKKDVNAVDVKVDQTAAAIKEGNSRLLPPASDGSNLPIVKP